MSEAEILEVYKELGTEERHFNTLQGVYRALASTWFLACFTAIGFLYTKENKAQFPFSAELGSSLISLAVSTCISLFWILDVIIYHRLLKSVLRMTEDFESRHKYLPALRSLMRKSTEKFHARFAISLYYYVPIIILQGTSLVFLIKAWGSIRLYIALLICIWLLILFVFSQFMLLFWARE
jgi:hypothetical protein